MTGEQRPISVVIAGGGTAGHIEPALAVADAIRRREPSARITALGSARGLESVLVPARGYPLELIPPVPLPRRPTADLLRLPGRIRAAILRTRAVYREVEADVVIGFGGYVALPAYLAARRGLGRRTSIPVVVHEANARAGLANKVGAAVASRVLTAVAGSGLRRGQVVGIPVRESITGLDRAALRAEAREFFHLDPHAPTVLVFGGSQGAASLNAAVSGAAGALAAAGIGVLHAYGPKNSVAIANVPGAPAYVAVPYLDRMDLAYAAADAVICRSGAMTVAEVSAVGLPAVYVPLPHGNGEQELNASSVVAAGGGWIVADADLTPEVVGEKLITLLNDPAALAAAGTAAAASGSRDAADVIAEIVVSLARAAG